MRTQVLPKRPRAALARRGARQSTICQTPKAATVNPAATADVIEAVHGWLAGADTPDATQRREIVAACIEQAGSAAFLRERARAAAAVLALGNALGRGDVELSPSQTKRVLGAFRTLTTLALHRDDVAHERFDIPDEAVAAALGDPYERLRLCVAVGLWRMGAGDRSATDLLTECALTLKETWRELA